MSTHSQAPKNTVTGVSDVAPPAVPLFDSTNEKDESLPSASEATSVVLVIWAESTDPEMGVAAVLVDLE